MSCLNFLNSMNVQMTSQFRFTILEALLLTEYQFWENSDFKSLMASFDLVITN